MQSKITTQPLFNLASAAFPEFPNDDFIDIMTAIGSITEDLDLINHALPEAEVGVAIAIIIETCSIKVIIDMKVEVNFIQIQSISDPKVVEGHLESLI